MLQFLFLLLMISASFSFNNPMCKGLRYLCNPSNKPGVCINITDSRNKIHLLKSCDPGYYCQTNMTANRTVFCQLKPALNKTLPGEFCKLNTECDSNNCGTSGVCIGKLTNKTCKTHADCDIGLFCNITSFKCSKQLIFGENCTSSFECANNCGCNKGKCAYYYSLSNNIQANNPETCYSGYIQNETCSEGRKSKFPGIPCSSDEDCALINSKGESAGYSQCACGINGAAFSYCKLSEGDAEFRDVINKFQFLLLRGFDCHTMNRKGPCRHIYNEEYIDFEKARLKYENYEKLVFNDPCIKQIYNYDYWSLDKERNASFMIGIMGVIFMSILI